MLGDLFENRPSDIYYNDELDFTHEQNEITDVHGIQIERTYDFNGLEGTEVIVTGNPEQAAENLDWLQGDNSYNAGGCCTLVSSANVLELCGIESSEEEIVSYAVENNLCNYNVFNSPENNGGAGDAQIEYILESHGVPVSVYNNNSYEGSVEGIARAIENGKVATIGINCGYAWNDVSYIGDGTANHQITVTGTVRDGNGELLGLTICDSGRGLESDACRFLSVEDLEYCYTNISNSTAIITDNPVR